MASAPTAQSFGRGVDFINVANVRMVTLAEPTSFDLP